MSDCINGRSGCIAATQIHYHTPGYVHLEDEITAAFAALRAQLAEVTRELAIERERNPHRVICPKCRTSLPCESCAGYSNLRSFLEDELSAIVDRANSAISRSYGWRGRDGVSSSTVRSTDPPAAPLTDEEREPPYRAKEKM